MLIGPNLPGILHMIVIADKICSTFISNCLEVMLISLMQLRRNSQPKQMEKLSLESPQIPLKLDIVIQVTHSTDLSF